MSYPPPPSYMNGAYAPNVSSNPPRANAPYSSATSYQYNQHEPISFADGQNVANRSFTASETTSVNPGSLFQSPYGEHVNSQSFAYDSPAYRYYDTSSIPLLHSSIAPPVPLTASGFNAPPVQNSGSILATLSPTGGGLQTGPTGPIVQELEDGEVSSGELSAELDDLYAKTPDTQRKPPINSHNTHETVSGNTNLARKATTNISDSDDDGSISLDQSPYPKSIENQESRSSDADIVRSAEDPLRSAQFVLQQLHSFDIGYQDILREGFEANLLRSLYIQTGLPLETSVTTQNKPAALGISKGPTSDSSNVALLGLDLSVLSPGHQANDRASVKPSNMTDSENLADQSLPSTLPNTVSNPRGGPSASDNTKTPAFDKSSKMTRKDYIAKMLAAKAGKAVSSPGAATESSRPDLEVATNISPSPHTKSQEIGSSQAPEKHVSPLTVHLNQSQPEHIDLEAKRKAQTDLARQKMEALRRQRETQSKLRPDTDVQTKTTEQTVITSALDEAQSINKASLELSTSVPAPPDHPSYFSPVTLQSAFSLPGLFTTAGIAKIEPPPTQSPNKPFASDMDQDRSSADTDNSTNSTERLDATETNEIKLDTENRSGNGTMPRKRQKAADFIDSPSSRPRIYYNQSEEDGVVIDISDEEEAESVNDVLTLQPHDAQFKLGFEKDKRDISVFPPLTDTPVRKRPVQDSSTTHTPPTLQTAGKVQEPEMLKSKEIEIDLMNRRIKELEQRIKAKQASSRAQSPGQSSRPAPAQGSALSTETGQAQSPLHATNTNLLVTEPTGDFSQKSRLPFDGDNQDQHRVSEQPSGQLPRQTEGNQVTEISGGSGLDLLKDSEVFNLGNAPDHQQPSWPPVVTDEAKKRKAHLETVLSKLSEDILKLEGNVEKHKLDLQGMEDTLLNMRERQNQISIEFDGLQGDAEQKELNDEHEGAQKSHEAITTDSPESRASHQAGFTAPPDGVSTKQTPQTALATSRELEQERPAANGVETPLAVEMSSSGMGPSYGLSEGELEEDGMDISRSEMDEGELSSHYGEQARYSDDVMDTNEDDEDYEPPKEIGSTVPSGGPFPVRNSRLDSSKEITRPGSLSGSEIPTQNGNMSQSQEPLDPPKAADADNLKKSEQQHQSVFVSDEDESDDYEPPEPNIASDTTNLALRNNDTDPHLNLSATNSASGGGLLDQQRPEQSIETAERSHRSEMQTRPLEGSQVEISDITGHFTPYDSPLKQFRSYRFHPEYLQEVPNGFRSLTYSNAIRPEVELCQYELGGTCNDKTCTSQHFREIGLSDELILSEMGKHEGASPQERESYISGLRDTILDLRKRKVKDLDSVASEISRYRTKTLGDTSKILPL